MNILSLTLDSYTGEQQRLRFWQLTPMEQDIEWTEDWLRPHLPTEVEWACRSEQKEPSTGEWHPAALGGFSALVLRFTLNWPPFKLEDPLDRHQPQVQRSDEHDRVLQSQRPHVLLPPLHESRALNPKPLPHKRFW